MQTHPAAGESGLADAVYVGLVGWGRRFPAMSGPRARSMARSCAAACPGAPAQQVLQAAIFCMILFGIDDLADRTLSPATDEEIDRTLAQLAALAHRGGGGGVAPTGPAGQVWTALAELCAGLAAGRPERPAYRLFARHLEAMLEGMRAEVSVSRAFAERGELPTWDAYVALGTASVGIPPVGAVLLLLDEPAGAPLEAGVEALLGRAARCIRFANDLRSYAREVGEQKPNSVTLLMHGRRCAEAEARAAVAAARDADAAALPALARALPPELRRWGEAFLRYCTFIKDWYALAELHEAAALPAPQAAAGHPLQKGTPS